MFYNPASLALLEHGQTVVSISAINISSEFRDRGSTPALTQPLGSEGGDAGDWNVVPSVYVAWPLNERIAFGFGINVPFGLKLEYSDDWMGRFQALNSEIATYNFNPALAWRVNDVVTIGFGINYQRLQAELTNAVNYTAIVAGAASAAGVPPENIPALIAANAQLEGKAIVRGDDGAWGFNVGVSFELTPTARLGFAYRSGLDYDVEGSARFLPATSSDPTGASLIAFVSAPGGPYATTAASVDLELPDIATVSFSQRFGERWQLLADVAWTGWSSVEELRVVRPDGTTVSSTPEHWRDTWRFALGASYRVNDAWTFKFGVAFDESAVPDSTRTPRLPDTDRTWVALGARYDTGDRFVLDVGYAHLFSADVPLDQHAGEANAFGHLVGQQESAIDILGVQFAYRF